MASSVIKANNTILVYDWRLLPSSSGGSVYKQLNCFGGISSEEPATKGEGDSDKNIHN